MLEKAPALGGWGSWPRLKRSLVLALVGRTPDQGTFLFSF